MNPESSSRARIVETLVSGDEEDAPVPTEVAGDIPPSGDDVSIGREHPGLGFLDGKAMTLTRWTLQTEAETIAQPSSRPGAKGDGVAAPVGVPSGNEVSFKLLRQVGLGGMGEVWEAMQMSLGRVVAVKRLRSDQLPQDDESRALQHQEFRQEAAIAARLEHPNIVPVHDMGVDAEGTPLIAMKHVQGRRWDQLLNEDFRTLSVAEFLARHLPILLDVSQAVAFAHSRGIIHRDVKPAQVMVGEFGEVLLMDWGLAVWLGGEGGDGHVSDLPLIAPTPLTASAPAGTPSLMAPEQTEQAANGIGVWTDVYLLGGTLYWLLTGSYPHQAATPQESFLKAVLGEVDDPNSRAGGREVPRDLARLALHALARETADRPASVRDFMRALQDYMSGASRRRDSTELTAMVAEGLSAAGDSYSELARHLDTLERARDLWPENPALPPLRADLLDRYVRSALASGDRRLARVQAERLEPGELRRRLLFHVGRDEVRARRHAMTRRLAIVGCVALLAVVITGGALSTYNLATAQREAETSRASSEELVDFMLSNFRRRLADLNRLDLLDEVVERALAYYSTLPRAGLSNEELVRLCNGLIEIGQVLREQRNLQRSAEVLHQALDLASEQYEQSGRAPAWSTAMAGIAKALGDLAMAQGSYDEAARQFRRAVAIQRRRPLQEGQDSALQAEIAQSLMAQGKAESNAGDLDAALATCDEAVEILRAAVAASPGDRAASRALGLARSEQADLLAMSGDEAASRESLEEAGRIMASMAAAEPANDDLAALLAGIQLRLGDDAMRRGDPQRALTAYRMQLEARAGLADRNPAQPSRQWELAVARRRAASALVALERWPEAEPLLQEAAEIMGTLAQRDPGHLPWGHDLAAIATTLAEARLRNGNPDGALVCHARVKELVDQFLARDPHSAAWRGEAAALPARVAEVYRAMGDVARARSLYAESIAAARALVASDPANWEWFRVLEGSLHGLAELEREAGDGEAELAAARGLLAAVGPVVAADPGQSRRQAAAFRARRRLADALRHLGRHAEALESLGALLTAIDAARDDGHVTEVAAAAERHRALGDIVRVRVASGDIPSAFEALNAAVDEGATSATLALDEADLAPLRARDAERLRVLMARLAESGRRAAAVPGP